MSTLELHVSPHHDDVEVIEARNSDKKTDNHEPVQDGGL